MPPTALDGRLQDAFVRHACPPMIDEPHRLGLIWAPKSASAISALWFFAATGRVDAARAVDTWPHDERIRQFHDDGGFHAHARVLGRPGFRWVRVIRDPYRRAVSMYRHALNYGNLDQRIGGFLDRPFQPGHGFSFMEMLGYLADEDPRRLDPHFAPQWHPVEELVTVDRVINADREDIVVALSSLEETYGLARTDLAALAAANSQLVDHVAKVDRHIQDAHVRAFPRAGHFDGWPDFASFINPDSAALIERIHRIDFEAYRPHL